MPTKTVEESVAAVRTATPDTDVRICRRVEIGTVAAHQGDIYVHRVADDHPRGAKLGTRKLAIGQGEGSNHVADGDHVDVYDGTTLPQWVTERAWMQPGCLLGRVVVARSEWCVGHTTHKSHALPAGTYQVTYQADRRTSQRVQD